MEVCDVIDMNTYFHDPRFSEKKPNLRGTWQQRCGDNFYSQALDGSWTQHRNRFHIGPAYLEKDTRNPYVFVSKRFWYFGREAVFVPERYIALVGKRGIRVNHPRELCQGFLAWVQSSQESGVRALPTHNPDAPA